MPESNGSKRLTNSKTFWVNIATAAAGVLAYLHGSEVIADNPNAVAGIGLALGLTNVVLRILTGKPIKGV